MQKIIFLWAFAVCCLTSFATENLLTAERWSDTSPGKYEVAANTGNGTLDFEITGSGGVSRYFPLKPEWKALLFQFDLRTDDVVAGPKGWQVAKMEVLFFDKNNKQTGGWPDFATATGTSFKRHSLFYKIPEGAVTVRITPANMGISGNASFRNVSATPMLTDRVADLDALPPEGTAQDHMSLDGAERWGNAFRDRICLNGLWQFFPLKPGTSQKTLPEKGSGWCWFKVPGAWPAVGMDTAGNSQEIVYSPFAEKLDPLKLNEAWYRREFTVPAEWQGKQILLSFTMLQTKAQIRVDGKIAGEVDFPGGQIDLTGYLVPGRRQELAILVSANPEKSGSLFMSPDVVVKISGDLPFRGITGDLYLEALPREGHLTDVHMATSVRRKTITFDVGLENALPGRYRLKAGVLENGECVKEFQSEVFELQGRKARKSFGGSWDTPKLWDTHHPEHLYRAEVSLERADGKGVDMLFPEEFGFREFWVDGRDFYLNGSVIHLRNMGIGCSRNGAFETHRDGVRNVMQRVKDANFNAIYGLEYSFKPGIVGYIDHIYEESSHLGVLSALTLPHANNYDWNLDDPKQKELYIRHAEHQIRRFQNLPGVVMYTMNHNATGHIADQSPLKIGLPGTPDPNNKMEIQALKAENLVKVLDPGRVVYHHAGSPGDGVYAVNFYLCWAPIQERTDWFENWEKHGTRPLMLSEWGNPHVASYSSNRAGAGIWHGKHNQWFWPEEYHAEHMGQEAYRLQEADKALLDSQTKNSPGNKPVAFWWGFCYPYREPAPVINDFVHDNYRAFRVRGVSAVAPWDYSTFWNKIGDGNDYWINPDAYRNLKRRGCVPDFFVSSGSKTHGFRPDRDGNGVFELSALGKIVARNFADYLGFIAGREGDFSEKGHYFAPGETVSKQLQVVNDSRETGRILCRATVPELAISLEKELTVETGKKGSVPLEFQIPASYAGEKISIRAEFIFPNGQTATDFFAIDVVPPVKNPQIAGLGVYDPEGGAKALLARLGMKFRNISSVRDLQGVQSLIIGRRGMKKFPFELSKHVENGLKILVLEQEYEDLLKMGFRANMQGLRQVYSLAPDFRDQHWYRGSSTLTTPYLDLPGFEPLYPVWSFSDFFVNRVWRAGNRGNVSSVFIEKPPVGNFVPVMEGGFDLQYAPLLEQYAGKGYVLYSQLDLSGRTEQDPEALRTFQKILVRLDSAKEFSARQVVYQGDAQGKEALEALRIRYAEQNDVSAGSLLVLGPGSDLGKYKEQLLNGLDILALTPTREELAAVLKAEELPLAGRHFPDYANGLEKHDEFRGISNSDLHWRHPIPFSFAPGGGGGRALRVFRIGKGRLVISLVAPWMFDKNEWQYRTSIRRSTFLLSRLLHNLGAGDEISPLMFDRDFLARRIELENGWLGLADPQKIGEKKGYCKPEFKPGREWRPTKVNMAFESQFEDLKDYDGNFWYRKQFDLDSPIDPAGQYVLNIPAVDDESWCWLNGKFIGEVTAKTHPNNYWFARRMHRFPGNLLKPKGNVLVILCNDIHMSAGVWGVPTIKPVVEENKLYTDNPDPLDNPYRYSRW